MNTKHTPAPWTVNPKAKTNIRHGNLTIANCSSTHDGSREEEEIANAKLIAAAPDLLEEEIKNLEFLKWVASKAREFNMWSDKVQELHERISKTEAAIKKSN
jgi:hypothetical protein